MFVNHLMGNLHSQVGEALTQYLIRILMRIKSASFKPNPFLYLCEEEPISSDELRIDISI